MSKVSGGWYVALVRPNSVEIALRNLLRQGFEVFYPREFETRRKGTKFVDVVRPVFPGYLFVSLAVDGSDVRKVNSTYGVARLVSFGGAPARVPNDLVATLRQRCDRDGFLLPPDRFASGDQVVLSSGPFANFVAEVQSIAPDKRVWVLLEVMGSQARVLTAPEHLRSAV